MSGVIFAYLYAFMVWTGTMLLCTCFVGIISSWDPSYFYCWICFI